MRFIGYKVGKKHFGCSSTARKKAEKFAAETNQKVELYRYKI